jgi:ATP-dependent helicase/nuclease subunit A
LEPDLKEITTDEDGKIWRFESGSEEEGLVQSAPPKHVIEQDLPARPEWMDKPAQSEPNRTIPVAPSSIVPYEVPEDDEDKIPVEPAMLSPRTLGKDARFLRGRLVHKLLEHLPALDGDERANAAETLAAHHGRELSEPARQSIIAETLAILNHPDYQSLFGPNSRAEVTLIAKLGGEKAGGSPILLTGQVDRLVVRDDEVLIIDYKSNRPSPRKIEDVAPAYLAQLAAYKAALSEIYPSHKMRALLLWTDGPYLMEIPENSLDEYDKLIKPPK